MMLTGLQGPALRGLSGSRPNPSAPDPLFTWPWATRHSPQLQSGSTCLLRGSADDAAFRGAQGSEETAANHPFTVHPQRRGFRRRSTLGAVAPS